VKISLRSAWVGRSRKNISSNLPLRRSSGGRLAISLAVATTKQGDVFSCIQVRMVPKTRVLVPLSSPPWARAFSTSSIQTTQGATVSATCKARRVRSSDSPTREPNRAPTSNRRRGSRHRPPIIFAVRLFPVPGMPINAIPLGAGKP